MIGIKLKCVDCKKKLYVLIAKKDKLLVTCNKCGKVRLELTQK